MKNKLTTVFMVAVGMLAFFIVFPVVVYGFLLLSKSVGLWWVDTVGWWWNYWFSLIK